MAALTANPKVQKVCEFFAQGGGCKKGASCEYLHPSFHSTYLPVAPPPQVAPCPFFNAPGGCKRGVLCSSLHVLTVAPPAFPPFSSFSVVNAGFAPPVPFLSRPPPPGSKTHPTRPVPCRFHAAGGCKKGDDCDSVHMRGLPCEFFTKLGACKKGAFCEYDHVGPPRLPPSGYGGARRGARTARFTPY